MVLAICTTHEVTEHAHGAMNATEVEGWFTVEFAREVLGGDLRDAESQGLQTLAILSLDEIESLMAAYCVVPVTINRGCWETLPCHDG